MSSQKSGLSSRSLAELALIISRVGQSMTNSSVLPTSTNLQSFWQSNRSLQQRWSKILDEWTRSNTQSIEVLESLAPTVFATEMLVRTFGTILITLDQGRASTGLSQIGRSCVSGLAHIRNGLLARLLSLPESCHERVMAVDRLRRRCDRWTDLLIGPIAYPSDCFEFAYDAERARDFGEEGTIADPATGPHPIEHLVSAGLRLTFLQHLSAEPLVEPEFVLITRSTLACIPEQAFNRSGSLRTAIERRIVTSHHRSEHFENFQITSFFGGIGHVVSQK